MFRSIIAGLAFLLPGGALAAQTAPGCLRGGPLPSCGSFWITEAAYGIRVTPAPGPFESSEGDRLTASLDLGGMKNVSGRLAVGGSAAVGALGGIYLAVKPRVRYWVSRDLAADFAPGVVVSGVRGSPRFTADLSLMYRDKIGITTQTFVLPNDVYDPASNTVTTGTRVVTYAGLRLGSKLGVLGAAGDALALLGAIGLYLVACGSSGCD